MRATRAEGSSEDVDDLARAYDFILRADMIGTRTEPLRYGTAVFAREVPLRHDSNYLLFDTVPPDVGAADLVRIADEVQGAAGLAHRCIMVRDGDSGERLAPAFEALAWDVFRGVVMALRRAPDRDVDTSRVVRTESAALRAAREEEISHYPWGTPEVARQLLDARSLSPVATEHFAVFADGRPVSWAELYVEGGVAQIEAVATVAAFRGRGFARAVVLHAVSEARRRGARLVFLCADATDWVRRLYGRLGFDEIGRYVKFVRPA